MQRGLRDFVPPCLRAYLPLLMIFLTVGAQMPFDRLVRAVDDWAGRRGVADVVAQIGATACRPRHLRCCAFLDPPSFTEHVRAARLVVAHAGMGSILTALEHARPILVMPRRGALGETRNDHQVASAARFARLPGVRVAHDEAALSRCLDQLESIRADAPISAVASPELLGVLREFVFAGRP